MVPRHVLRTARAIVRGPGPPPSPSMVLEGPSAFPTDCPGRRSRAGTPNTLGPSVDAHPWALTRSRLAQPVGVSRASTRNPDWPCEHATKWLSLGPAIASCIPAALAAGLDLRSGHDTRKLSAELSGAPSTMPSPSSVPVRMDFGVTLLLVLAAISGSLVCSGEPSFR